MTDQTNDQTSESGVQQQVVVFKLVGEEYAAPILDVQEIIPAGDITSLPNVADYIEGIINVRGTVATVINLSRRFNLDKGDDKNKNQYIVLTKMGDTLFGMMVDEVSSVMKIDKTNIKSADSAIESKIHADYINGVAVVNDRVIIILDFQKILNDESMGKIQEATAAAKKTTVKEEPKTAETPKEPEVKPEAKNEEVKDQPESAPVINKTTKEA